MENRLYRTGTFAGLARVSVRTLRYYDRVGLLTPSETSLSGHRLYSDDDLIVLQKILAMKLLGFTLAEIKSWLTVVPMELPEALAQQKAMLEDRRDQLDRTIRAIADVEAKAKAGKWDWDSLLRVIEVIQMQEDKEWAKKYLTDEQIAAMKDISSRSCTPDVTAKLEARQWTAEDQERVSRGWADVYAEAARLAALGASVEGDEAQAMASRYDALIREFTQGDPQIEASLFKFYAEARDLPAEQSPYPAVAPKAREFAEKAYMAFRTK